MSSPTLEETVIKPPALARPYDRRRGVFGAIGLGVVAAIADMIASPQPASAGLASPCC